MDLSHNLRDEDQVAIRTRLDELQTDLTDVLRVQTELGSITNRLELTQNRIESRQTVLSQQVAQIQNVDLPELITDLNFQEQVSQASLGVLSNVLTPTLLDFI